MYEKLSLHAESWRLAIRIKRIPSQLLHWYTVHMRSSKLVTAEAPRVPLGLPGTVSVRQPGAEFRV